MAGQGSSLMADAFLQATIADNHPGSVINQGATEAGRQQTFRNRHADGIAKPLTERTGRRLDRRVLTKLRMPGGGRMQLPEPA